MLLLTVWLLAVAAEVKEGVVLELCIGSLGVRWISCEEDRTGLPWFLSHTPCAICWVVSLVKNWLARCTIVILQNTLKKNHWHHPYTAYVCVQPRICEHILSDTHIGQFSSQASPLPSLKIRDETPQDKVQCCHSLTLLPLCMLLPLPELSVIARELLKQHFSLFPEGAASTYSNLKE